MTTNGARKGAFTFVLHSHLPYCRQAGRWPHGEEWIHEAASETYIPLLDALYDLRAESVPYHLTLSLTPVLVEQLADQLVLEHLREFLTDKLDRARRDIARFASNGDDTRRTTAEFYQRFYANILESFEGRFGGDLIGAFRLLQDEGLIEIATSAATHAYLPLADRDSAIYAQLKTGVDAYARHFGRAPRSIWLPECGYRPGYYRGEGENRYVKPGIEAFLASLGLVCFFAETHTIEGGMPVGKALGDAIGPYGDIPRRYLVPLEDYPAPTQKTTFLPYWVQTPRVAVLGRNERTGLQVWSAEHGYPGDYHYREFHKKDGESGLQYWKITGAKVDLAFKAGYVPEEAQQRVQEHAAHYAGLVDDLIIDFHKQHEQYGIVVAAYDTELFGHWWFEGVDWLREVLRLVSRSTVVDLTTASAYVTAHPPVDVLALPEGSWGQGGGHFTWLNADTRWMWPLIHEAEADMEALVALYPQAAPPRSDVLNQAARELLLLQSSDWPFLVTTGQAAEYAINRFREHHARFQRMAAMARQSALEPADLALVQEWQDADNLFSGIDYHVFKNREGEYL